QREEVATDRMLPVDLAFRGEPVLRGERQRQSELDRAVVGRTQPSGSEWRQRPDPLRGRETRAARELRLCASKRDQEILPPPRVGRAAATTGDGFFADTGGASDRSGALSSGAGTLQRIHPVGHLVEQVLMRLRPDRPASEWYGNIRPSVTFNVAIPLEGRYSTGHT